MKWSSKNNRWASDVYTCKECAREFGAHSEYIRHENYYHRKNKKSFPKGMQTASQLLLLGFLTKKIF